MDCSRTNLPQITYDCADIETSAETRAAILAAVRGYGICVVANYFAPQTCDRLVNVIEKTCRDTPDIVSQRSDLRIFGADALDMDIDAFRNDAFLEELGTDVVGKTQRCIFTMANKLETRDGQPKRSGGDWHRDRLAPQFKAMVYLSDVGVDNGPFSFYPGSNRTWPYGKYCAETGFDFFANRWRMEEFSDFAKAAAEHQLIVTAPKGSMVIFESSNIHSGLPIVGGQRYAITNYYYAEDEIDVKRMARKFTPIARPITMPDFSPRAA